MTAKTLAEAGASLAETVEDVRRSGPVLLTEGGEPVAAIVSLDDWRWLEEAEDRWLAREADAAWEEHLRDPGKARSHEEVWADIEAKLREG